MRIKTVVFESRRGATLSFHTQTVASLRTPSGEVHREVFDEIGAAARHVALMFFAEDASIMKLPLHERVVQVRGILALLPVALSVVESKAKSAASSHKSKTQEAP